ncbi:oligosaccharide flippase family protein [Rhodanobacter sp. Col0626]|uniref:oligosaccharide flippase family protein n=1 Tax=Rhodanobacter sp. Col0626 TaxID=3415679 RepID=UPI003CF7BE6B
MSAMDVMPDKAPDLVAKVGKKEPRSRRMEVLRSVTIVSVATYIEYALGLVFSIWIARALGPTEFGRYAFTIWLCGWLIICSNHALTTSSTKFIAEALGAGEPGVAAHISHRLGQYQHLSSFIVLSLFVIGTFIIRPTEWNHLLLPVTVLVIIAVAAKAGYGMLAAVATGQERFEPEAIAAVLAGVLGLPLVIGAALLHQGVLTFIAIFAIASLTLNLINRVLYRWYCQPYVAGPIPEAIATRLSRHLRLTGALVLLGSFKGSTIEVFLLNTFSTSAAVGFFAIAATLTRGAVQLFSVGLTSTLLPYMAKSFGQHGQEHAARFLSEATRFYWAVGIAIAGLGLVTTPDIVTLMYGNRYVEAIPAIEATLVLAGLLLIGNGISAFQTVVDRQDDRVRITVVALVANAILGIVLIPPLGLTGAVLTYAGTRFTDLGLAIYYLRRATTGGLPIALMSRLFAVGVVATASAWLLTINIPSRWGFVAGVALFVLIYLPGSVLVRYWSAEDFRLMGMIGNRLGPPGRLLMRGLGRLQSTRMPPSP